MVEPMSPSEGVLDLTAARRRLPIDIEGSVVFEIPLIVWSTFSTKNTHTAHDLGKDWHENVRDATASDLVDELTVLGGPRCATWLAISSLMLAAPHPHDPDRVLDWLGEVDEQRLRRWILGYDSHNDDQARIEQAATGDIDAATQLLGDMVDDEPDMVGHFEWLLTTEDLPSRYAGALREFREKVFSDFEDEFAGAISRAAAARRAAPPKGSAKEVVEEVTSGIDFEIPVGVSRVVLIPSVITRPLSLIDAHRGTLVVFYGIADEFIDSDPEAPPSWLVRTYKALSDERRLRILRRLSESPTSLDDLSDMLDLSKSTVHHHIALLRGAGLVRVHIGEDKSSSRKIYSLREQSLTDATGFLESYLSTEEKSDA